MSRNSAKEISLPTVRVPVVDDGVQPEASDSFVSSPYVQQVTQRALAYLIAGYPVHFSGVAGTGKTTLAFHVASKLGRPVTLVHGDDEFGSSDLVGREGGYRKHKVVDNFIHSVLKTEEESRNFWVDDRLTTACKNGEIFIYDEFNRSRPEANNALLSVLSEGILNLPKLRQTGEGYLTVHPEFRAIFTSNPEEYAGVHKTQDALMDRLITITLEHYDRETEVLIVKQKSGLPKEDAERIVDMVRELRMFGVNNHRPTIRAGIAIGRILFSQKRRACADDEFFRLVCRDVLATDTAKVTHGGQPLILDKVDEVLYKVCGSGKASPAKRR
ncbi:MAG: gas vesicle protein GvpN [bacterium]|jgi:gas vesicle protein GvpN